MSDSQYHNNEHLKLHYGFFFSCADHIYNIYSSIKILTYSHSQGAQLGALW